MCKLACERRGNSCFRAQTCHDTASKVNWARKTKARPERGLGNSICVRDGYMPHPEEGMERTYGHTRFRGRWYLPKRTFWFFFFFTKYPIRCCQTWALAAEEGCSGQGPGLVLGSERARLSVFWDRGSHGSLKSHCEPYLPGYRGWQSGILLLARTKTACGWAVVSF